MGRAPQPHIPSSPLWCISPEMPLCNGVSLSVLHQWPCLCSCPVTGFWSIWGFSFFSFQKTYWIRAHLSTAGLIHLTQNADLVAAINGDLWAEMEKLHAPAPPTIYGCGPAHLLSFGKRKRHLSQNKIFNSESSSRSCGARILNLPCPGTPASQISPQTSLYFGTSSTENCNILSIQIWKHVKMTINISDTALVMIVTLSCSVDFLLQFKRKCCWILKKLQTENIVQKLRLVLLIDEGRYCLSPFTSGWQSPVLTKIKTVWKWPLGRSLNGNHIIINHCLA